MTVTNITDIQYLNILIVSLGLILIGTLFHFIVYKLGIYFANKFTIKGQKDLIEKLKHPTKFLVFLIVPYILPTLFELKETELEFIHGLGNIMLIIGVSWLFIQGISYGKNLMLKKYDMSTEDNLEARKVFTQFSIIQRIFDFTIILVAIALILMNFDSIKKLGVSLLASAGIAGLILGLAAQKLLTTILAGLQIAITQPIRLEDVVIVENEWGWIEEITLTYVVVRIWDKRRLIVPTTYFIEKPFQNWTRTTAEILGTVFIYTDYNVSVNAIREELTKILSTDKNWDGKVNVVQVTNTSEKTVEIRALLSAKDSPTAWDLRVNVREKLLEFLQNKYPDSLPKTRVKMEKGADFYDHDSTEKTTV